FKSCYKKSDTVLPLIHKPLRELYTLLIGNDLHCCSFRTNIRAYNSAFAFTSVSYKKDERINFIDGI
ncbi:hypothetical protein OIDMADRAFT_126688, partial [Oidiodendron maius Zn]